MEEAEEAEEAEEEEEEEKVHFKLVLRRFFVRVIIPETRVIYLGDILVSILRSVEAPFRAQSMILGLSSPGVASRWHLKSPVTRHDLPISFSLQDPVRIKTIIVETGKKG